MLTLQVIHGASTRRTGVHVRVEGLMVQTVLVNGRLIVIHCCDHLGGTKKKKKLVVDGEKNACVARGSFCISLSGYYSF